jgi:hypothetical protein
MKTKNSRLTVLSFAVFALAIMLPTACQKGASDTPNQPAVASSPKAQTPFERDLDFVRQGSFTYVFVFSRKDGGVFTAEDIAYLKASSPPETNQWVSTDDGKRVIAGTNFEFKQEHFDALYKRFNIENLSGS